MTGRKTTLTEADRAQKQQASRTHGMYALENRGEAALDPEGRTRLQELRELFESEPGRVEYRKELAAHIALMLELGFSSVRETAERGGNIWKSSPVGRMGTYLNSLIRLIDGWPKDKGELIDVTELLRGGKNGND
jgi:hypothetical protein